MQQPVSKPRVSKSSLSQVSSNHAKGTSDESLLKNDLFLSVDIQNLKSKVGKNTQTMS